METLVKSDTYPCQWSDPFMCSLLKKIKRGPGQNLEHDRIYQNLYVSIDSWKVFFFHFGPINVYTITGKGYGYIYIVIIKYYFLSQEVRQGRTGNDSRFVYSGKRLKSKY